MAGTKKNKTQLKSKISLLPEKPGVFLFKDKEKVVIYVGKAKNLKKRVVSYFAKSLTGKTAIMMNRVREVVHVIVDTESDALLLENNLIKKHQPRYNILLKDDKTYPWICIKNERFPRIYYTRNKVADRSKYYGPYTSMVVVRTLLDTIKQLYPIRNCKYQLTEENIGKKKFKICLEYHMGNCKGPCVGLQDVVDYDKNIEQIENILKGNIRNVFTHMKSAMDKYATDYQYEEANRIKEKIQILERFQSKSTIVSPRHQNLDVFSYTDDENHTFINYLKVSHGAIIQAHMVEVKKKLDESKEDLLLYVITEIRKRAHSSAKEIITPFGLPFEIKGCHVTVPRKGDKKKLLELCNRNLTHHKLAKRQKAIAKASHTRLMRKMETLTKDLRLKELPIRIECFDNSNIHGKSAVAACVVFRNASPSKKEYRHYNIKTVEGPDDYASMAEVVFRRYKRLLNERRELPQLIVIDGGKGQLNAAIRSLENLGIIGKTAIIGIAKRLEEIYFPGDSVPLYLDKNSESLKILQHLRNEAHRFGISFHRNKRSQEQLISIFDEIKGIGSKSKERLIIDFKSIEGIKKASLYLLEKSIGPSKARIIYRFLHNSP